MKSEWTIKKISEIADFNPRESLPKGVIAKKVGMDKLQPFCRDIPSYEMEAFSGGSKFRNGDTIMARITPCLENGKTAKVDILDENEIGFGSTEYIVFRAKEGVDEDFLYYLICSSIVREPAIKSMVGSSGRQRVQMDVVQNLDIAIPTYEEQCLIGGVLRNLDDKIKINNKINENLLEQLHWIFIERFTKNPNLESIAQIPLANLCSVITKGTTPTTLGKTFTDNGINFLKAESILDSHFFEKGKFAHIDLETNKLLKRSIIEECDIVFTIAGTLGRFALVNKSVLPANTNQAVAIIRANQKKICPEYLYSCFIGNWHNDYYSKRIQQAVQANLSLTTIKSLPIPILQGNEMSEYIDLIFPLIAMHRHISTENERISELRDSLLPKLMSGEIDVSDIDI